MNFNKLEFWIQIHNIPLLCMTEEIGIFLGKMIGEVRDVDFEAAKDVSDRFIRVRVVINVNETLLRSLRADLLGNVRHPKVAWKGVLVSRKRDGDIYVPNYDGEWKKKKSEAAENVVNRKDEVGVETSAPHVDSTSMESGMEKEIRGVAKDVDGISSMQNEALVTLEKSVTDNMVFLGSESKAKMKFLMETRCSQKKMELWRVNLGYAGKLVVGCEGKSDFNEIMSDDEKRGGKLKNWRDIAAFREATEDYLLKDLGFVASKYTWCNKREGNVMIMKRLDRRLGTKDWKSLIPNLIVHHLDHWKSDLRPLLSVNWGMRGKRGLLNKTLTKFLMVFSKLCLNSVRYLDYRFSKKEIRKGASFRDLNSTVITLILKVQTPSSMTDCRLSASASLLFTNANDRNCGEVCKVLDTYLRTSGYVVNYNKSTMCFSPFISKNLGERLASLVGVNKVDCHETYLGLPYLSGRNKRRLFSSIVDWVWYKIKGQGEKFLSIGGKEILVKAVIQSISTYAMAYLGFQNV
ncbi:hypothetical protein Ddye_032740 [Dipteronia dyeriana]|uniref:DUF4283 domain-containing protein n=1 Tax=Dipteronia dyeriana TaxID=168575 RepID=A0AAD9WKJ6_9ROSI|nr:hypothetical protein Ddye_032740 [Dipteronia dyeriana]